MKKLKTSTAVVLGIAFAFFVGGIACGDPLAVWNKARYICLECIGIG